MEGEMMDSSTAKNTTLFILGMTLGAGVVALAATNRGKEVQQKFKDALERGRVKTETAADDVGNELEEAMQTTRDRFGSTKLQDEKGLQTG